MPLFFCCLFNTVSQRTLREAGSRLLACALLLGPAATSALAAPPVYLCPGNLFSNHLEPAQARAMGCQLAAWGRLSQARDAQTDTAQEEAARPATNPTPDSAASTATANNRSATAAPAPLAGNSAPVINTAQQRARDSDAKEILRSELARTQAQIQALTEQNPGPETDSALQRLRADEAALRRELARLPS